ncbi:diaminopimelate decarboxylase [Lottiidibacillus patelloidae]|uniref:diaminopimelate decarboxylase n=1 Tax=Lottiidibacillus patelloidae TaxID=2670334 RepID=UPI001E36D88F|nr:diaminopimelate decarboxylase [Lottiidibacillus patelloidae]
MKESNNNLNHLLIGGISAVDLAKKYGTPLIAYDVELIRKRCQEFKDAFAKHGIANQVAYASKAFCSIAIVQVMKEEGMSLDVVSGGELHTALSAGFPPEKIHFHGNNKSKAEIEMAIDANIGCFVVDNFYELALLEEVGREKNKRISVLLRMTPGIEAHTHEYILTGQEDSKFGFDLLSGQGDQAIVYALKSSELDLLGIHCHIGSQIFETTGFILAADKMFEAIGKWKDSFAYVPKVVNLGGGFGIRYVQEDEPLPLSRYVDELVAAIKQHAESLDIKMPEIWIEPGRSIVGEAGTTIYQIGSEKDIPNVRKYVSIDGGMSDNLRPALYDAKYHAVIANRVNDDASEKVSIAGKCCETGDMLIWDIMLPKVEAGEYLAVFSTGAYGYSMANNYNRIPRPAVVFVENGQDTLVIKRETYDDIVKNDLPYKSNALTKN